MAATDYSKLKVAELKDVLKERGIPQTGLTRKQQIIDAIEANDAKKKGGETTGDAKVSEVLSESRDDAGEGEKTGFSEQASGLEGVESEYAAGVIVEQAGKAKEVEVDAGQVGPETAGEPAERARQEVGQAEAQSSELPSELAATEAAEIAPTVLEHDEPVSSEPTRAVTPALSQASEAPSTETRKRKRRSPTPPLREESVSKKLRAAEDEPVKLPEDEVMGDAPVPIGGTPEPREMAKQEKVLPASTIDDVMDVSEIKTEEVSTDAPQQAPGTRAEQVLSERHAERSPEKQRSRDFASPEVSRGERVIPPDTTMPDADDISAPPAIHAATAAIYIRDLVRPLQQQQLRKHLLDVASSGDADMPKPHIESLHLDTLKSHAFVLFDTVTVASRIRSNLHGVVWPNETGRKPLWIDFMPEEKVEEWTRIENEAGGSRRDSKRWEVAYTTTSSGAVEATLEEVRPGQAPGMRQPSFSSASAGTGLGMPNAPSGPRGSVAHARPSNTPLPPPAPREVAKPPESKSFSTLDTTFKHTTAKPKLYYQPVSASLVDRRLDEFDAQTARDWNGGRSRPMGGLDDQLRRYTFEDGDRLVDGGVDFGGFGRRQGAGGGGGPPFRGGGGRGGGFGGGYRGR